MQAEIARLIDEYDGGGIDREALLRSLTAIASPEVTDSPVPERGGQRMDGALRAFNINHVNIRVSDLDRSEQFYRQLFSLPPRRAIPGRPFALDLGDGTSFLSLPERPVGGVIDHFCVGVEDFDPARAADALRNAGIVDGLEVRRDNVYVTDPDGTRVQVSTPDFSG